MQVVLPQHLLQTIETIERSINLVVSSADKYIRRQVVANTITRDDVITLTNHLSEELIGNLKLVFENFDQHIERAEIGIKTSMFLLGSAVTQLVTSIALLILISWFKNAIPTPIYIVTMLLASVATAFFSAYVIYLAREGQQIVINNSNQKSARQDFIFRLNTILVKAQFIVSKTYDWSSTHDTKCDNEQDDTQDSDTGLGIGDKLAEQLDAMRKYIMPLRKTV